MMRDGIGSAVAVGVRCTLLLLPRYRLRGTNIGLLQARSLQNVSQKMSFGSGLAAFGFFCLFLGSFITASLLAERETAGTNSDEARQESRDGAQRETARPEIRTDFGNGRQSRQALRHGGEAAPAPLSAPSSPLGSRRLYSLN